MSIKAVKTRVQNKHDIPANWEKAINFIPLAGELIIYDDHYFDAEGNKVVVADCIKYKIGDGIVQADGTVLGTKLNDLPFVESAPDQSYNKNSSKAQSGTAVAEAIDTIEDKIKITGTVTTALGGIAKDKEYTNADIADVLSDLLFPYVAPSLSSIALSAAAGTFEYGTTKTVSKVTPNFTKGSKAITSIKIGTTNGGSDLYSGTTATSGTAITLTNSKTFDGTTGGTIYCTISDGTQSASANASISYAYYNYVIVSNSTTVPTSKGSGGKNLAQSCEVSNLATTDNSYIWFLMPNQNKKQIQEYAMNQWNNISTTPAGSVTFTTDTGKSYTYYAYRTDKMMSNTSKYRIN